MGLFIKLEQRDKQGNKIVSLGLFTIVVQKVIFGSRKIQVFSEFQVFGFYFIASMEKSTALRNALYETLVYFQILVVNLFLQVSFRFRTGFLKEFPSKGMHSISV